MKLKKEQTIALAIGLVAAVFSIGIYLFFFRGISSTGTSAILRVMQNSYAKTLPKMIDDQTELDSVSFEGTTFIYVNRLVNYEAKDIAPGFDARLKPNLVKNLCANAATRKNLLDHGVTMRYRYYDKAMVFLADVDVLPADCAAAP